MKQSRLLISLLVATLVISACGTAATEANSLPGTTAQSAGASGSSAQTDSAASDLPNSLKMALGTFKLADSANDISAEEAAALLPLWKAVRSLGSSETVATEEIEALYIQIQETMSADQIAAIDQMELTQASMAEIAEDLGIELFSNGGRFANMTTEQQATAQAARESGEFPQGGFPLPGSGSGSGFGGGPGGGGGFGGASQSGGGNITPEQQATMTASRAANGGRINIGVPTALLDALIQYLEGKAG